MNRKPPATSTIPGIPAAPPFLLWSRLALQTWETLLASSQVIGIRVGRMAIAGPRPTRRDRVEFTRMGTEKAKAATASSLAVGLHFQKAGIEWMTRMWQPWLQATPHQDLHLATAALAPFHAASTANARRLSRLRHVTRGRRTR